MGWTNLKLATQTAGSEYGGSTLRVAEVLRKLSSDVGSDNTPAVVWMYSPDEEKANQRLNSNIFQNEQVGLAMKKFRTLRVNVLEIDHNELRAEYSKNAPAFYFFDPAGGEIGKVAGKKATSLSGFTKLMEKSWNTSYETKLRKYTKSMTKLLDQLDRIDAKKQNLERNKERLALKPNAGKQRKLSAEEEQLQKDMETFNQSEQKLLETVKLRSKYLPDDQKVAQAR